MCMVVNTNRGADSCSKGVIFSRCVNDSAHVKSVSSFIEDIEDTTLLSPKRITWHSTLQRVRYCILHFVKYLPQHKCFPIRYVGLSKVRFSFVVFELNVKRGWYLCGTNQIWFFPDTFQCMVPISNSVTISGTQMCAVGGVCVVYID